MAYLFGDSMLKHLRRHLQIREKILCYHGILIYDGKCLMVRYIKKTDSHEYRVHYNGWSKSWDEWVPEGRLLKFNDANVTKQKKIKDAQTTKTSKRKSTLERVKQYTPTCITSTSQKSTDLKMEVRLTKRKEIQDAQSTKTSTRKSTRQRVKPSTCNCCTTGTSQKSTDLKMEGSALDSDSGSSPSRSANDKKHSQAKRPRRLSLAQLAASRNISPPPAQSFSPGQLRNPGSIQINSMTANIEQYISIHQQYDIAYSVPYVVNIGQADKVEPAETETSELPSSAPPSPPPLPEPVKLSVIKFNVPGPISRAGGFKLNIPTVLEEWIILDWDKFTQNNPLWVTLPAELSVAHILARYALFKLKDTPKAMRREIRDIVKGMERLFNVCLGRFLLHRWERLQYDDVLEQNPNTPVSKLYGAHHFLRMFAMLAESLNNFCEPTNLDPVCSILSDLMNFLVYQRKSLFKMTNYSTPPPEYHRRAFI